MHLQASGHQATPAMVASRMKRGRITKSLAALLLAVGIWGGLLLAAATLYTCTFKQTHGYAMPPGGWPYEGGGRAPVYGSAWGGQ